MTNLLNLGKGHPNTNDLPYKQLIPASPPSTAETSSSSITQNFLAQDEALQYGDDAGSLRFRKALFSLLEKQRPALRGSMDEFVRRVMQTNGASQGLDMICGRLTKPGDVILVETPTYFYAKNIFEQRGLQAVQIPTNVGGGSSSMDLNQLDRTLDMQEIQPRLLYTVPVCNNPMGFTLSRAEAEQLVLLAKKYDFTIVADEVYLLLQFDQDEHSSLQTTSLLDIHGASDVVISVNSFSKILGPGIRVGWIEAKQSTIESLLQASIIQSGGGLNPFSASYVATFVESGQQAAHIQHLRCEYQKKYNTLTQSIQTHLGAVPVPVADALGESCSRTCFVRATGGYFLWLRFASDLQVNAEELIQIASSSYGVTALPGKRFLVGCTGTVPRFITESVRLCFAYLGEEELNQAVQCLAEALDAWQKMKREG